MCAPHPHTNYMISASLYIYIRMYIAMICTYYINIFIVLWWCFMYLCNGMAAHISHVMISHIIGVALLTRDAQLPQPTGPPDSNQLASVIKIEKATLLCPLTGPCDQMKLHFQTQPCQTARFTSTKDMFSVCFWIYVSVNASFARSWPARREVSLYTCYTCSSFPANPQ